MEVKFQSMLNEMNVTVDQLSKGLQKDIQLFDDSWQSYNDAYEEYSTCTDPQEKQVLMEELNQFERDLIEADGSICKKIQYWDKNKEAYALKVQRMAEGREKKKAQIAAQSQNEDVMVAEPQTVLEPQPDLSGTVVNAQGSVVDSQANTYTNYQPTPQPEFNTPPSSKKEESGGSLGWWILGGAIAILTLGVGAKYLKNK